MKKLFKGIIIGSIVLIGLVSCSSTDTTDTKAPKTAENKPAIEKVEDEPADVTPEPVKVPDAPKTPEISSEQEAEREYQEYIVEQTGALSSLMTEISTLFDNPTINEDWLLRVKIMTSSINLISDNILEYPNVPAKFENVHSDLTESMNNYKLSMEYLTDAIDNGFDENMLEHSIVYLGKGNEAMDWATEGILKMK